MDSLPQREPRVLWSFWVACGLALTGGIAPLLLAAGGTNRIAGVVIPFGIAAAAMAVAALTYRRGRSLATSLYFLSGIALVYGMLSMVAVPLRLAVVGTCPPAPADCPAGLEQALTSGESSAFAFAVLIGTLAIFVGFFGLLMLYRIRQKASASPPVRRDTSALAPAAADATASHPEAHAAPSAALPPTVVKPEQPAPVDPPQSAVAAPAPPPQPARKPRIKRAPKPQAELPPPASPLELPPPASPLELPASSSPSDPGSDEPSSS